MPTTSATNRSFRSLSDKAERALLKADFNVAIIFFCRALAIKRGAKTAIGGLLIADFCAKRGEFAAQILELYLSARAINPRIAKRFALGLIEAIETEESETKVAFERFLSAQNGVDYKEFLALLDASPSFSDLFEKITRSTNVFISRKNDWFDLMDRLIENNYIEIAYRFIENASPFVGMDERSDALLAKLREKEILIKNSLAGST
ncbi:MAG: hypothetical protein LBI57_01080 [Helicobacteraceae bacterium]|jgi:hypothetical protein|nr:hypothetical protein [Helicobacteraceae bacterium]